ncbi:MAG TPA: DEAD/DEAH box helicase [Acidimicrobiales bacterium]|nr:DEAD/DEAH box helicase [Acidimicrobiales bacterium]
MPADAASRPQARAVPVGGERGFRAKFLAGFDFDLDPFQVEAMDALDEGHSVVVAAPTGSGKTLVAEYAVERALATGGKVFYTTPLKALSNQKFADFGRRYGTSKVGLLTGDNAINGDAPVVVMTTEVLRNMIYAGSGALDRLRYVVLDEVHYLQDPYRGPVWEEIIIHLPMDVDLVCLSATVSNAEELADWVGTVRGSTRAIIEERRPVPLHNLYLVGDRRSDALLLMPTLVDDRPNPKGIALTSRAGQGWRAQRRSGLFTPRRSDVVALLDERDLLPAIYFIFSRAGCDEAVRQCIRESRRLTTAPERRLVRQIAEEAARHLSEADLAALGYANWLAALEAGYAAHHAGMVPPFKEAVEQCFTAGLVKVVFATETLALGINMPARSVVIERLAKFSGERVEPLTPGEYTQLTGRAGRRGTDEVGYAVALWAPNVTFDQVASLAGARSYTLTSSFRPTYNMATNLVRRCAPEQARHLLNLSFAQYRSDADIVRLERQLERANDELVLARSEAECERGDIWAYRRLVRPGAEQAAANERAPVGNGASIGAAGAKPRLADILDAMGRLKPGDVVLVPKRKPGGARSAERVVVLSTAQRRRGDVSLRGITMARRQVVLGARDFHLPPRPVARLELPQPFAPRSRDFQRKLAATLSSVKEGAPIGSGTLPSGTNQDEIEIIAGSVPVASCPHLRSHMKAAARAERLGRQVGRLQKQVLGRSDSLARQFDRVLRLLEAWGYVHGWSLTASGERLSRTYHPQDLLVAECAERGLFDGLKPAEMAAFASIFTYEPRGPGGEGLRGGMPNRRLEDRWRVVQNIASELARSEESIGLPLTRSPEPGFAPLALGWATGRSLAALLSPADGPGDTLGQTVPAGDFVRNIKQLVDLLRQLGEVLPSAPAAQSAREAADALFRGVVAVSSVGAGGASQHAVPTGAVSA